MKSARWSAPAITATLVEGGQWSGSLEAPRVRALTEHVLAFEVSKCPSQWRNVHWTFVEGCVAPWGVAFAWRKRSDGTVVFYVDPETNKAIYLLIAIGVADEEAGRKARKGKK